jgi:hypothetical protein
MSKGIMRYVRDGKGRKVGMLVGKLSEFGAPMVEIGWSRCREGDTFDRTRGYEFAVKNMAMPVPPSFYMVARRFRVQCFNHFNASVQEIDVMDIPKQKRPLELKRKTVRNSGHRDGCQYPSLRIRCLCKTLAADAQAKN